MGSGKIKLFGKRAAVFNKAGAASQMDLLSLKPGSVAWRLHEKLGIMERYQEVVI